MLHALAHIHLLTCCSYHLLHQKWKYVDIDELKEILAKKIADGFAFPLNPKWILCDEGWKDLYDKLFASEAPNVQDAMNVWYPADVRERIAAISSKYPVGYGDSCDGNQDTVAEGSGSKKMKRRSAIADYEQFNAEIAELELERYKNGRSGVNKLRKALLVSRKTKKKAKKNSLFLSVLLMLEVGKEANAQMKLTEEDSGRDKPGGKKPGYKSRRRSTIDSEYTASTYSSPFSVERTSLHSANGNDIVDGRSSRRGSFTNYIRKRLSISSKKKWTKKNDKEKMKRSSSL